MEIEKRMKAQGQAPDLRNNRKELSGSQRAYWGVFLISFIFMLILHQYITKRGDDIYFTESVKQCDSLFHWFQMRYLQWSSRLLFEAALVFLLKLPDIVWKVLDSMVFAGIACLVSMQTGERKRSHIWLGLLLCFIYPFGEMASAGYIATTLNYLWPLFFLVLCLALLAALSKEKESSVATKTLYYTSLVLAASIEQACVILFGVYILQFIKSRIDKEKVSKHTIIGFVIILLEMVFILTCPGNALRRVTEATGSFPEYAQLTLFRLLEMGVSSIGDHCLLKQNFLFFLFSFVLCLTGQNIAKSNVSKVVFTIPLAASLCFSIFFDFFYSTFPNLVYIAGALTKFGIYTAGSYKSLIPLLLFAVTGVVILYYTYVLYKENKERGFFVFTTLIMGFASRMVMCFSPSIWASANRTFIFMDFAILIATISLLDFLKANQKVKVFALAIVLAGATYFSHLVEFIK